MNNLRSVRQYGGYTQIEISELTGISQSSFSELERGIHKPNRLTKSRIEKVLGKIDWLETTSIKLQNPNYYEAEKKLKELIELTLSMKRNEKEAITKLVLKYFHPKNHKNRKQADLLSI